MIRPHVADERVFEASNSAAIPPLVILGLLLISVTLNGGSACEGEGIIRSGLCQTCLYKLAKNGLK